MSRLLFAAVADDDTGATDLAGMLAEQGLRVILLVDIPTGAQLAAWAAGHEAVILATATRAIPPQEAYRRTREALLLLKTLRPRTIEFKYCSTFDSTPQGNIGPSIDAAFDLLGIDFTVALPALPVNGRTTYNGYHYVHEQLISDSPMRSHPLNPMANPNLVTHLQNQTARRVGLAPYHVVNQGPEALKAYLRWLREQGVEIAILDCLDNSHLATICESIAGIRFITGSSAPGIGLPPVWRKLGWWRPSESGFEMPATTSKAGCLFVAGSCSEATRAQNRWLIGQGVEHTSMDPRQLLQGHMATQATAIASHLSAGRNVLITTASDPSDIEQTQLWAAAQGKNAEAIGLEIANALARFTKQVLMQQLPAGLIAAGGETSSALCRELGFGALRIGANIEPGVPLCYSLAGLQLPVVLKSGNFGSEDFYGRAERSIRQ
ncbi:MAG: four-carbon acid sugar kinase family protein [Acidobacteriia bacterium]|nr:four-carbon acid sugar kinase family protein [Terriglobia bacterium]